MNLCLLSFDIEEWYHSENVKAALSSCGGVRPSHVEETTNRLLETLDSMSIRATFFVLGCVAEVHPALIRTIARQGHEVASHGYSHRMIHHQTSEEFREDVRRSKRLLEDNADQEVIGYRAPTFTINDSAIDILQEEGYSYDSSYFPAVAHDRYGRLESVIPSRCSLVAEVRAGFHEVLIPTLDLLGIRLPWGGGGYFRFIPYRAFRWGARRISSEKGVFLFYLHPWEIDRHHPRISGISLSNRIRQHFAMGRRTETRLLRLLDDFRCGPIKEWLYENASRLGGSP